MRRIIFLLTLILAAGFQVINISYSVVPSETDFYLLKLGGELIIKICFIMTLGARLAYIFLADRSKDSNLKNTNRLIDLLTVLMLFGFILFNLRSYVWFSEIMILPVCLFFYSFQE